MKPTRSGARMGFLFPRSSLIGEVVNGDSQLAGDALDGDTVALPSRDAA